MKQMDCVTQQENTLLYDVPDNTQKVVIYHHDCNFDTTTDMTICAGKNSTLDVYCIITNCRDAKITINV